MCTVDYEATSVLCATCRTLKILSSPAREMNSGGFFIFLARRAFKWGVICRNTPNNKNTLWYGAGQGHEKSGLMELEVEFDISMDLCRVIPQEHDAIKSDWLKKKLKWYNGTGCFNMPIWKKICLQLMLCQILITVVRGCSLLSSPLVVNLFRCVAYFYSRSRSLKFNIL